MKKIITFLMCAGILAMLLSSCNRKIYSGSNRAYDTANIGTTANDGTGDPLRTVFIKYNNNWQALDAADIDLLSLSGDNVLVLTTTAATNVTLPTSGTLRGSTTYQLDNLTVSGTTVYGIEGSDSTLFYTPVSMRDDAATLFTQPISFAGDTSLYPIPDKVGDLYIDSSAGIGYLSVYATRGGWRRITNLVLPILFVISFKRRKRK